MHSLLFNQKEHGTSRVYIRSIMRRQMRFHRFCQEFEPICGEISPSADLLVTAVDPNLGFTGGSYRAANWQQWMTVKARPYLYENGYYVTPSTITRTVRHFESQSSYKPNIPERFQQSRVRLLDSMIYCCSRQWGNKSCPCSG